MKLLGRWRVLVLCVLVAGGAASGEGEDELTPEHRRWLEEEVAYILLEREKEVFLALQTIEERERFIEAFWRRRDPNLTTPQNEFRDEHYLRIDYANRVLGRSSARPGWMTDRGRIHIILGEPTSIERFQGYNEVVSSELWFYQSDPNQGLPPFFYLIFFRPHNTGDFQLYSPLSHGPSALLSPQLVPTVDGDRALEILRRVSPELRRASLSLDPADSEGLDGRPSLGADVLLARIADAPKRLVRSDYADAWLRYGERVEAEYSFNFVPNRSSFVVLAGSEGTPFVHFTIELDAKDFAVETDEERSRFYTTLEVEVEVTDALGNRVESFQNEPYIELTPSAMERILTSPFAYQDNFPLLPGRYTVTVVLKNPVMKRFTIVEHEMQVPSFFGEGPRLSGLALGYHAEATAGDHAPGELRTFQIGGLVLQPAADHVFVVGEAVHAMVQALGAGAGYSVRFRLRHENQTVQERSVEVSEDLNEALHERFSLLGLPGGNYVLEAELFDREGKKWARGSAPVIVSPRSEILRPWTYRRSFDTGQPGSLSLALARQHLALGQFPEARARLERASAETDLPAARWLLAGLLIQSGDDERALALLHPLEADWPHQFEVIGGLGTIYYLRGDWARAVSYLERAVAIRPPDTGILNALGESYQRLGESEKAGVAFERSLRLNPDQKEIQKLLTSLTEKPK
ncbi:MAG: GWxTD domain-containing protein [Vicinamibacteria bacterium]